MSNIKTKILKTIIITFILITMVFYNVGMAEETETLNKDLQKEEQTQTNLENIVLIKGYATSYTAKPNAKTCTGDTVREGICGGYKPYIGKKIILYKRLPGDYVGEKIGEYDCLDTGTGTKSFQEGKVIDVFKPSLDECQEFMNLIYEDGCQGHVWIQIIEN